MHVPVVLFSALHFLLRLFQDINAIHLNDLKKIKKNTCKRIAIKIDKTENIQDNQLFKHYHF